MGFPKSVPFLPIWQITIIGGCQLFEVLRFSPFFRAVLRFSPIFRAVFVRFCGFNSSVRFAFFYQNLVRFFGFGLFCVAVLRFLSFENIQIC